MATEECAFVRKPSIILEQFLHISGTVSRARGIIILTFVQNNWTVIASLLREDTRNKLQSMKFKILKRLPKKNGRP